MEKQAPARLPFLTRNDLSCDRIHKFEHVGIDLGFVHENGLICLLGLVDRIKIRQLERMVFEIFLHGLFRADRVFGVGKSEFVANGRADQTNGLPVSLLMVT